MEEYERQHKELKKQFEDSKTKHKDDMTRLQTRIKTLEQKEERTRGKTKEAKNKEWSAIVEHVIRKEGIKVTARTPIIPFVLPSELTNIKAEQTAHSLTSKTNSTLAKQERERLYNKTTELEDRIRSLEEAQRINNSRTVQNAQAENMKAMIESAVKAHAHSTRAPHGQLPTLEDRTNYHKNQGQKRRSRSNSRERNHDKTRQRTQYQGGWNPQNQSHGHTQQAKQEPSSYTQRRPDSRAQQVNGNGWIMTPRDNRGANLTDRGDRQDTRQYNHVSNQDNNRRDDRDGDNRQKHTPADTGNQRGSNQKQADWEYQKSEHDTIYEALNQIHRMKADDKTRFAKSTYGSIRYGMYNPQTLEQKLQKWCRDNSATQNEMNEAQETYNTICREAYDLRRAHLRT